MNSCHRDSCTDNGIWIKEETLCQHELLSKDRNLCLLFSGIANAEGLVHPYWIGVVTLEGKPQPDTSGQAFRRLQYLGLIIAALLKWPSALVTSMCLWKFQNAVISKMLISCFDSQSLTICSPLRRKQCSTCAFVTWWTRKRKDYVSRTNHIVLRYDITTDEALFEQLFSWECHHRS